MKQPADYQIAKRARDMRRNPTPSEAILWARLRNRLIEGRKFRHQVWIGSFIVDFVCLNAKLVIEADGSQHLDNADYDHHRSLFLAGEGYRVLRFWNNEIIENIDGVLELVRDRLLNVVLTPSSQMERGL